MLFALLAGAQPSAAAADLPGLAVSALGDGMSVVAVSRLALRLAPAGQRGTWVAVAVAAYSPTRRS